MLGSHVAAWDALRRALEQLAWEVTAEYAAVLDESNDLWCAWPPTDAVAKGAERFYQRELAARRGAPLRRGGRLSVVHSRAAPEDSYIAESFAGIYVLLVGFEGAFEPFTARSRLRAALPRIEALTFALPPPDGPEAGEAAGKRRG